MKSASFFGFVLLAVTAGFTGVIHAQDRQQARARIDVQTVVLDA